MKDLLGRSLYILVGETPVPEPDVLKWAQWMHANSRVLARTHVARAPEVASVVSTMFLGADQNRFDFGPPLLFETTIFTQGEAEPRSWRAATWLEAEAQHRAAIDSLQVPEK